MESEQPHRKTLTHHIVVYQNIADNQINSAAERLANMNKKLPNTKPAAESKWSDSDDQNARSLFSNFPDPSKNKNSDSDDGVEIDPQLKSTINNRPKPYVPKANLKPLSSVKPKIKVYPIEVSPDLPSKPLNSKYSPTSNRNTRSNYRDTQGEDSFSDDRRSVKRSLRNSDIDEPRLRNVPDIDQYRNKGIEADLSNEQVIRPTTSHDSRRQPRSSASARSHVSSRNPISARSQGTSQRSKSRGSVRSNTSKKTIVTFGPYRETKNINAKIEIQPKPPKPPKPPKVTKHKGTKHRKHHYESEDDDAQSRSPRHHRDINVESRPTGVSRKHRSREVEEEPLYEVKNVRLDSKSPRHHHNVETESRVSPSHSPGIQVKSGRVPQKQNHHHKNNVKIPRIKNDDDYYSQAGHSVVSRSASRQEKVRPSSKKRTRTPRHETRARTPQIESKPRAPRKNSSGHKSPKRRSSRTKTFRDAGSQTPARVH